MLSKRLLDLRKSRGYSQAQVAMKLGISQGAISQWEHGTTVPAAEQLLSLADIYGISVDEILGRSAPEPKTDDDAWELRERLRRDPDMRILFDAASKASPEHLKAAAAMLKALEPPEDAE
jgi:transcriptional regulator with XRE-family HTH domain